MSEISAQELSNITNFSSLVDLLRDKLGWPIDEDYGLEDIIYEYEANELGLKPEETAKIREIHQLRPLTTNQPWGIFFISFEEKNLSVTVLRRMLRALVVKKRDSAQTADRQSWQLHDLIFVTSFGVSGEREIAFAHFSDGEQTRDLPVMNVLGWNAKDTQLHNEHTASVLEDKLSWPDDADDHESWRNQWGEAFELRHGEVIRTSKDLALQLAALADNIRVKANALLSAESEQGSLRKMLEAFRKNLIHELDEDGFADMFAQTISYGLLAAHISRPSGALVADNLVDMIPKTNPFLRELFSTFLSLGGRDQRKAMDFDELGVRDVVNILRDANMEAVLRDFGDRNPKEDPVIHFYELFLKEYDPEKRMQRGVFYTPRPVVNFIVRGVDEVLREEFGLPLGLADITTWGELADQNTSISIPEHINPDTPFVQILDPATGTGTFLVEVIDLIYNRMVEHWETEGLREAEIKAAWNSYVPDHLLPRLTGFELMMAPYAIAHMKVGLKLVETGYTFSSDERARVFLTNALEPARDLDMEFIFMAEALAHEAQAANRAKADTAYTAVIGNPPYSGISKNMFPWIDGLLKGKEPEPAYRKSYYEIEGVPLGEKKIWLQDDYVKFIRLGQYFIDRSSTGVLGYISNNGYLENPTFRGMRWQLLKSFNRVLLIDLHGNTKKKETAHDGSTDENVFDIEQGVAICLMRKLPTDKESNVRIEHSYGLRNDKSNRLINRNLKSNDETLFLPFAPFYFFHDRDDSLGPEYRSFFGLHEFVSNKITGIVTARDSIAVAIDKSDLIATIKDFISTEMTDIQLRNRYWPGKKEGKYPTGDSRGWKLPDARKSLREMTEYESKIENCGYRPFDTRPIFYDPTLVDWGRWDMMPHMLGEENIALSTSRGTEVSSGWEHVFAFSNIIQHHSVSLKEVNYLFPLWLKRADGESRRRPNVDKTLAAKFGTYLGLVYEDGILTDPQENMGADYRQKKPEQITIEDVIWEGRGDLINTYGPRDLFDWIYAVLHSPRYRTRYAEFLKSDFPRIPFPKDLTIFQNLNPLGSELVALHLLKAEDAQELNNPSVTFNGTGDALVAKGYPKYQNGKVMINPTRWFEDVTRETWEFRVGGYQVCKKWLKDRAGKGGVNPTEGRVLTDDDILHYRRTVTALTETRRLMTEIDRQIEEHGGWEDAFYIPPPPPPTIQEIIQVDESRDLEFKSTFQWDIRESKKNKDLQKGVLKTLVAFMNSHKGGTLVIGITDDKEIHGLEDDLKLTRDTTDFFEQTILNIFENTIGIAYAHYCHIRFADAPENKQVCVIDVEPSSEPIFLNFQGTKEFFIRRGNASKGLDTGDQETYIRQRFE